MTEETSTMHGPTALECRASPGHSSELRESSIGRSSVSQTALSTLVFFLALLALAWPEAQLDASGGG